MARPFFNQMGFSGPEIFGVTKSFGVAATIFGGLAGGIVVARYGLFKALLVAGILQAITNLLFSWVAVEPRDIVVLTLAITADNFTGALGGVAFIGYLSSLCTAGMAGTQYALLTSLMAFGRTTMSAGGGWLAAQMGWVEFWIATTLLAIPGLLLLLWLWHVSQKENPSFREEGGGSKSASGCHPSRGNRPIPERGVGLPAGNGQFGFRPRTLQNRDHECG